MTPDRTTLTERHAVPATTTEAPAMPPQVATGELSLLQIVASAASNPAVDVDKMRALLDMQERILKRDAEIMFNQDMKSAQSEMEPICRDAQNDHTKSRYARLETIDARIRPVYTKYGFSLSFNSADPRAAGAVRVLCDVRHVGGHCKPYELEGDLDTAGAKGASNKTGIQGLGSSVSYLRRYLTLMIFNIALTNEDNDGQRTTGPTLTEAQVNQVLDLLLACNIEAGSTHMKGFLSFAGASRIEAIPQNRFVEVITKLKQKAAKIQEGA